jgi:DNA-binding response OmpR family regulator
MSAVSEVRVLIIDDEKAIRDILEASLGDDGFVTSSAADGVSGLSALAEFQPQIVLLDIWMPGDLDGLEVLQKAKAQYPNNSVHYYVGPWHN